LALSDDVEAVVIYQNINALSWCQYAKNGTIVRALDPLFTRLPQIGHPLPEVQGHRRPRESGEPHRTPSAFLLAERLTGIRLTAADLSEPGNRITSAPLKHSRAT